MSASTSDSDCLFCQIVAGNIPARRVHEDEHAIGFLDISPWHRGHTLVIPKEHVPDLLAGASALTAIAPAVDAVSRLLVERLGADGLNLVSSARAVAGQEVLHLHIHLVPRYADRPGLAGLLQRAPASAAELDGVWRQITGAG